MKPAVLLLSWAALVTLLVGCGGSAPSNATPVSGVPKRVFVANFSTNAVDIVDSSLLDQPSFVDSTTGQISFFTISTVQQPTIMLLSADKGHTLVYGAGANEIAFIDNTAETQLSSFALPGSATALVMKSDFSMAYAALPSTSCTNSTVLGAISVINITNGAVSNCVPVQGARFLALSHDGNTLLVFAGDSDVANSVNTGTLKVHVVPDPSHLLDRPVSAVFSADDSTAYIADCGVECSGPVTSQGTDAAVATWARGSNTLGSSVGVTAAREVLLDSGNLYVAGTDPVAGGALTVVTASGLTPSAPVAISDGIHDTAMLISGQLFIGARACSDTVHGCLTIVNLANKNVKFSGVTPVFAGTTSVGDDVTGMTPIPGTTQVYVIEGGKAQIYDTNTGALLVDSSGKLKQFDIAGKLSSVEEVF